MTLSSQLTMSSEEYISRSTSQAEVLGNTSKDFGDYRTAAGTFITMQGYISEPLSNELFDTAREN